jgi:hypothetical protein
LLSPVDRGGGSSSESYRSAASGLLHSPVVAEKSTSVT